MTMKRFSLVIVIILFALLANVQAQTPRMATVNITPDSDKVRISTIGDAYEMRVDVTDESGDVVFQSGAISGQQLDWNMRDSANERVPAGTYLVTVTYRNAAGKLRKRVEQVTVDGAEKSGAPAPATPAATPTTVMTSGVTTAGKIPKFATASTITNSVITQTAAGNLGIGITSPVAKLHVVGATTAASHNPVIGGENTSSGIGVAGHSKSGIGVSGESDTIGTGVKGKSGSSDGVYGFSTSGYGVHGQTTSGEAGRFDGKVTINGPLSVGNGLTVAGGCTGCNPPSDRNLKANFSAVNTRRILDRLASIPIQTWNYKSEAESVRHIGVMAQDFSSVFGFGDDNKTLNTVDAHGVTMAAIQGLYQMMQEKEERNLKLAREVEELRSRLAQLERVMNERAADKR